MAIQIQWERQQFEGLIKKITSDISEHFIQRGRFATTITTEIVTSTST